MSPPADPPAEASGLPLPPPAPVAPPAPDVTEDPADPVPMVVPVPVLMPVPVPVVEAPGPDALAPPVPLAPVLTESSLDVHDAATAAASHRADVVANNRRVGFVFCSTISGSSAQSVHEMNRRLCAHAVWPTKEPFERKSSRKRYAIMGARASVRSSHRANAGIF
jgi:hypothetical protein